MQPDDPQVSATQWWGARRVRYNLALAAAGFLAFTLYATLVWSFPERLPDAEITLFTIAFQGFGYLLAMATANVCYFLGPLSEYFIRPANVRRYRNTTYALGFGFSVALPFAIPAVLLLFLIRGGSLVAVSDQTSPEGMVDLYLDYRMNKSLEEMARLRDFRLQARDLLRKRGGGAEPSSALIESTAQDLEQRFRPPGQTTLQVQSCYAGAAHYESDSIAEVPTFCRRSLGDNMSETAAFMVRVIRTEDGWRIVSDVGE